MNWLNNQIQKHGIVRPWTEASILQHKLFYRFVFVNFYSYGQPTGLLKVYLPYCYWILQIEHQSWNWVGMNIDSLMQESPRWLWELWSVGEEVERGESTAEDGCRASRWTTEHCNVNSCCNWRDARGHLRDMPQDQVRRRCWQPMSLLRLEVVFSLWQQGGAAIGQGKIRSECIDRYVVEMPTAYRSKHHKLSLILVEKCNYCIHCSRRYRNDCTTCTVCLQTVTLWTAPLSPCWSYRGSPLAISWTNTFVPSLSSLVVKKWNLKSK